MQNRQIDKKLTFQVRIDREWQRILTQLRADTRMTIRALVEQALCATYPVNEKGQPYLLDQAKLVSFAIKGDDQQETEDSIIDPNTFEPITVNELAALEVWRALEPHNPKAFETTYLAAARKGLPRKQFYQFCTNISFDATSRGDPSPLFNLKVEDYLSKNPASKTKTGIKRL